MTVKLICPILNKSFDYTIPVISGNLGIKSKMVKLTMSSKIGYGEALICDNLELQEGDQLILKSISDTYQGSSDHFLQIKKISKAVVFSLTSELLTKASHSFSIKCPWGHWHRFTINIDGI